MLYTFAIGFIAGVLYPAGQPEGSLTIYAASSLYDFFFGSAMLEQEKFI